MIDLNHEDLKYYEKKHTWHALEEIMCARAALISPQIKPKDLCLDLEKANIRISEASIRKKLANYHFLASGTGFNNNSKLAIEVFNNLPAFNDLYCDIYNNSWSDKVKSAPRLFNPHNIELLCSDNFRKSRLAAEIPLKINWYLEKIDSYLDNIFKHTSPQHYVEHSNAIGCLDKIILVANADDGLLAIKDNVDINKKLISIQDFMGCYVQFVDASLARGLNNLMLGSGNVNAGETIILLAPENMSGMIKSMTLYPPTLMEMLDKVFSHEVGHLAFAFYLHDFFHSDWVWSLAEKQANWISSISHDGEIDDLIEDICWRQPPKYHDPRLLKHIRELYWPHR